MPYPYTILFETEEDLINFKDKISNFDFIVKKEEPVVEEEPENPEE